MHYPKGIEAWTFKRRFPLYYFSESSLQQIYVPVAACMKRKFVRIGYVFSGIDFRLALLQHIALFAQTFCICWCVGSRPTGLQCVNKRFIHCKLISQVRDWPAGVCCYKTSAFSRSHYFTLSQQDLKSVACTSRICKCSYGWSNERFLT